MGGLASLAITRMFAVCDCQFFTGFLDERITRWVILVEGKGAIPERLLA